MFESTKITSRGSPARCRRAPRRCHPLGTRVVPPRARQQATSRGSALPDSPSLGVVRSRVVVPRHRRRRRSSRRGGSAVHSRRWSPMAASHPHRRGGTRTTRRHHHHHSRRQPPVTSWPPCTPRQGGTGDDRHDTRPTSTDQRQPTRHRYSSAPHANSSRLPVVPSGQRAVSAPVAHASLKFVPVGLPGQTSLPSYQRWTRVTRSLTSEPRLSPAGSVSMSRPAPVDRAAPFRGAVGLQIMKDVGQTRRPGDPRRPACTTTRDDTAM
jgi:hypothetical protein